MADTREVRRSIRRLQRVKTWQLVVLLLLMGFIAATFLRLNNIEMVQRRDAVLAADKTGDLTATQTRLYDLQRYVAGHMNTNMGTIYLEGQYRRDSQKIIDTASNDDNPNGNVFKKAQDVCRPRYQHLGGYSQAYEQCMISEIESYAPAGEPATKVQLPKPEEYRHSYASPIWSADFAGFAVLMCALILFVIIGRLISLGVLRLVLRMRHKGL